MAASEKSDLKEQVALLPLSPGVYQFVDRRGTVIYVGKAKSLRKRVSSYFVQSKEHSAKVRVLVRQIAAIRRNLHGGERNPEFGIFVADGDVVEIEVAQIVIPIDTRRHERSGEEQQGKGSHRDKC